MMNLAINLVPFILFDRFNDKAKLESSQIHFHELSIPPFESSSQNPNSAAMAKYPSHLQTTFDSCLCLRQPMAELLDTVSATCRRLVVIHDINMSYTIQDATTLPNTELYTFNPVSAFCNVFNLAKLRDGPNPIEEPEGLPSNEGELPVEILNFLSLQIECLKSSKGTIYNSCRPIEGTYLDLLEKEEVSKGNRLWAIGPLDMGGKVDKKTNSSSKHKSIEWLDKQTSNSVLYVSFGTTTSMKEEEIKKLAMGLEQSGQKFIWVLRDADAGNIFEGDIRRAELPSGFEERLKEVGLVVRDWAPQVQILSHPSTGGFMSHCGWNSCLESLTMGVPIIGWPMHSDQPFNAFFLANVLGVGLTIKKRGDDKEQVTSSAIAEAVRTLIASEEGEAIRKKAKDLGGAVSYAVKEGGVSRVELESFIAHITR